MSMEGMERLQELQQKMADAIARMDNVLVSAKSPCGRITVTANANRKITEICINDEIIDADRMEFNDYLIITINNALGLAENAYNAEMQGLAGQMLF